MTTDDLAERRFVHSRLVDGTPGQVFAAFARPERLARWWGPDGFCSSFQTFELRPGGDWRFVMHGPDGTCYANHNVFSVVDAPRRLVIEHVADEHHFVLEITLSEQGAQTLVQWQQSFDTAAHARQIAAWVAPANEQNLDRLQHELARAEWPPSTGSPR